MSADCRAFRRALTDLLSGAPRTPELTRLGWDGHLLSCEACRELLRQEEALEAVLASLPDPKLPPGLAERVLARLAAEPGGLDRLLDLDRELDLPPDLAAGVLAGIRRREEAALDRLLDRVADEKPPVGLAARVLAGLVEARGESVAVSNDLPTEASATSATSSTRKADEQRAAPDEQPTGEVVARADATERALDRLLDRAGEVDVPVGLAGRVLRACEQERAAAASSAGEQARSGRGRAERAQSERTQFERARSAGARSRRELSERMQTPDVPAPSERSALARPMRRERVGPDAPALATGSAGSTSSSGALWRAAAAVLILAGALGAWLDRRGGLAGDPVGGANGEWMSAKVDPSGETPSDGFESVAATGTRDPIGGAAEHRAALEGARESEPKEADSLDAELDAQIAELGVDAELLAMLDVLDYAVLPTDEADPELDAYTQLDETSLAMFEFAGSSQELLKDWDGFEEEPEEEVR